jgi:hypothetical protein
VAVVRGLTTLKRNRVTAMEGQDESPYANSDTIATLTVKIPYGQPRLSPMGSRNVPRLLSPDLPSPLRPV